MKRRMIFKKAFLSAAGFTLALSSNVIAADWPEFRGSAMHKATRTPRICR
jgi:hypothetical protein